MNRDIYLQHVTRLWLGLPPDAPVPDMPAPLAARLLRDEERASAHRDSWGCWEYAFSAAHGDGTLLVPEIDIWLAERRAAGQGGVPLWPDGHSFALCISHDVDHLSSHVTPMQWARQARLRMAGGSKAVLRALPLSLWQARLLRPTPDLDATLGRTLALLAEGGVPASWFFPVWPPRQSSPHDCVHAPADPCRFEGRRTSLSQVVRAIKARGHDVGLHGSYASALEPGLLASERAALSASLGDGVRTTRQHWLHWRVDHTPALQDEADLKADGTLGFNGAAGFRTGTSLPYPLWNGRCERLLDVLEIPLSLMDVALFRQGAMGLDLDMAWKLVQAVMTRVAAAGGVVSLLIHPSHVVDPRVEALLERSISWCRERGAWAASHAHILDHWNRRKEALGYSMPSRQ